jgi:hypothetical protein
MPITLIWTLHLTAGYEAKTVHIDGVVRVLLASLLLSVTLSIDETLRPSCV